MWQLVTHLCIEQASAKTSGAEFLSLSLYLLNRQISGGATSVQENKNQQW